MRKKITGILVLLLLVSGLSSFSATLQEVNGYVGSIINLESLSSDSGKFTNWTVSSTKHASIIDGQLECSLPGEIFVYGHSEDLSESVAYRVIINSSVSGINIFSDRLIMRPGDVENIEYELVPIAINKPIINDDVFWKTTNSSIITVEEGKVTALTPGKALISATTEDGKYKEFLEVEVVSEYDSVQINKGKTEISLDVGEYETLSLMRNPGQIEVEEVQWSSLDEGVAYVVNNQLYAVSEGITTIYGYDRISGRKSFVRVQVSSRSSSIILNKTKLELNDDKKNEQLEITYVLIDSNRPVIDEGLVWTTSDKNVVDVDSNGFVIAKGSGDAIVKVITNDGDHIAKCYVKVLLANAGNEPELSDVRLGEMPSKIITGEKIPVVFENVPENFDFTKLKWFIREGPSDQIKVESNGVYVIPTVNKSNEVTIKDKMGNQLIWNFRAQTFLNRIVINDTNLPPMRSGRPALFVGQTFDLDYLLQPMSGHEADELNLFGATWTVDDSDVVEVVDERNGILLAKEYGDFKVTVTSDDSGRRESLNMKVVPMIIGIDLPAEKTLSVGDTYIPEPDYRLAGQHSEPFNDALTYSIDTTFIDSGYLKEEKLYEVTLIEAIKNLKNRTSATSIELARREKRLDEINSMLEYENFGYSTLLPDFTFRDGKRYEIIQTENGIITAIAKGKLKLRVTTVDNEKDDLMTIVVK